MAELNAIALHPVRKLAVSVVWITRWCQEHVCLWSGPKGIWLSGRQHVAIFVCVCVCVCVCVRVIRGQGRAGGGRIRGLRLWIILLLARAYSGP